jgi:hypothetical protein
VGRRPFLLALGLALGAVAEAAPWTDSRRLDEARARLEAGDWIGAGIVADEVLDGRPEASIAVEARGLRALAHLAVDPETARDDLVALTDAPGRVGLDARWRLALLDLDAGRADDAAEALRALRRRLAATDPALPRVRFAEAAATATAVGHTTARLRHLLARPRVPRTDVRRGALAALRLDADRATADPSPRALRRVREGVGAVIGLDDPTAAVRALLVLAEVDSALGARADALRDLDLAVQAARLDGVDPRWRDDAFRRFEQATQAAAR